MRSHRPFQSRLSSRFVALAVGFLMFAALSVGELDHALLHASAAATVHDEASHPNAAPHIDDEEHPRLDECVACIHGSKTFVRLYASSGTLADSDSSAPGVSLLAERSDPRVAAPPRAPPA